MSDPAKPGLSDLAKLAGEIVEVVVRQETEVLRAAQAEMEVLLKGGAARPVTPQSEAEVEATFDNLPV